MLFGGIVTAIAFISLLSVGLLAVYPLRMLRDQGRLLFGLMCISLAAWVLSNYLSDLYLAQALFWIQVSFSSIVVAVCSFLLFGYYFPKREGIPYYVRYGIGILTIATLAAIISPHFIAAIRIEGGISTVSPGVLYPAFIIYFFLVFGYSFYRLLWRRRRLRGKSQLQVDYVLTAIVSVAIVGSLTNLILPLLLGNNDLYQVGSASSVVFVGIIGYSMLRYRLFDIRFAIARSFAYILSLGFIGLVYGAVLYILSSSALFVDQSVDIKRAQYILLALVTAILYPPVLRFFAKATNRILYQDAYDPERLFNSLNRLLVMNAEPERMLTNVLDLLSATFKTEFCAVVLRATGASGERLIGRLGRGVDADDISVRRIDEMAVGSSLVVVADDLQAEDAKTLSRLLERNGIAALARLIESSGDGRQKTLGHIIFGQKKSGRPYNGQDLRVIEAITNELIIAIQNAIRFEEIEKFNVTLQEEVDAKTGELRRKNKKLEELDNIKDDFISMASHQLRTPLTSVKGYLSMMIDGDAGTVNPVQDKMLHQAYISAQRMVFLITDLLNVSRLKTGKFVIDPQPTNLAQLIEEEVEQLVDTAKAKKLTLQYSMPRDFPELMLDEVKIRQVVMNFIDNAIYYTPEGGHIDIELTDTSRVVELHVTDDGIGVPRAEQPHLFTKFYRAANARKARPDGTGLGLFMAQKVIIAQGGSVVFHSKEGQGSTFGFSFPLAKLRVPDQPAGSEPSLPPES